MSEVYSNVATLQNAPNPGANLGSNITRAKPRVVSFNYTAASLASASVIRICKLFPGDVVLLCGTWIGTEATLGSGRAVSLGDTDSVTAADPDRYLEATSLAAAGNIHCIDATACLDKIGYVIQEECWLQILTAGIMTGSIVGEVSIASLN